MTNERSGGGVRRGLSTVAIFAVLLSAGAVRAEAGAPSLGVGLSAGAGVGLMETQAKAGLHVHRRAWGLLEVRGGFRVGVGATTLTLEGSVRPGLVVRLARRFELILATRVGYAAVHIDMPYDDVWVDTVHIAAVVEGSIALSERLRLRVAPLVAGGYWNELWGFMYEPAVGLDYVF